MGIFEVACPQCGNPHLWFSGSMDQRCGACMIINRMADPEIKELKEKVDSLESKLGCAEDEVKCLRSVLSEWDFDKSCYTQMIRANEFNRSRGGPGK